MVASGRVSNVKNLPDQTCKLVSEGAVEISSDNALFNSS